MVGILFVAFAFYEGRSFDLSPSVHPLTTNHSTSHNESRAVWGIKPVASAPPSINSADKKTPSPCTVRGADGRCRTCQLSLASAAIGTRLQDVRCEGMPVGYLVRVSAEIDVATEFDYPNKNKTVDVAMCAFEGKPCGRQILENTMMPNNTAHLIIEIEKPIQVPESGQVNAWLKQNRCESYPKIPCALRLLRGSITISVTEGSNTPLLK